LQGEALATLFVNIAESQAQKFSSSSSVVKSKSLEKVITASCLFVQETWLWLTKPHI